MKINNSKDEICDFIVRRKSTREENRRNRKQFYLACERFASTHKNDSNSEQQKQITKNIIQ